MNPEPKNRHPAGQNMKIFKNPAMLNEGLWEAVAEQAADIQVATIQAEIESRNGAGDDYTVQVTRAPRSATLDP